MVVKAQESTLHQGAADDTYDGTLKWVSSLSLSHTTYSICFPFTISFNYHELVSVLQITAEFQMPAPLAPRRHLGFVRFCKKLIASKSENHTWVVVDVSKRSSSLLHPSQRRRPSGWIIAVDHNGYTVVKHYPSRQLPYFPSPERKNLHRHHRFFCSLFESSRFCSHFSPC